MTGGMIDFTFEIKNYKELYANLSSLPKRIQGRILKGAVQAGGVELARSTKAFAKGDLRKSIKSFSRGTGSVYEAYSTVEATAFYAKWVEKGHKVTRVSGYIPGIKKRLSLTSRYRMQVTNKKSGRAKRQSKMPVIARANPHPFMRPAFDTAKDRVVNTIAARLAKRIEAAFQAKGGTTLVDS